MTYAFTGARLRELRMQAGLSQETLAELIGIRPNQISYWETTTKDPKAGSIGKLCSALQVEPTRLFQPVGT